MEKDFNIIAIHNKIMLIKQLFYELETHAESFPALKRNSKRALASLKMMELSVSDIVEFDLHDS